MTVEHHCLRLDTQLEFLSAVWDDIGERLQVHQNSLLHVLQFKLQEATRLIDGLIGEPEDEVSSKGLIGKKGHSHKVKYSLFLKERLEKTTKDLEKWHEMFDPSWFLITRISNRNIDRQLTDHRANKSDSVSTMRDLRDELSTNATSAEKASSVFITVANYLGQRKDIPFSSLQISQEREGRKVVIVDTIISNPMAEMNTTRRYIRNLARVLSKTDPLTFGLLTCRGVIEVADQTEIPAKFEMIFNVPHGLHTPKTLRSLLITGDQSYPLTERLDLAKRLANSVMFVHTSQFVHKNIRPDTVVVFENETTPLGAPFLVGFENFRPADGRTYKAGDSLWEKDLYRHPRRQGLLPEEEYVMQHDVYSLGVCLLEIGLWTSFVYWNEKTGLPTPGLALDLAENLSMKDQRKKAFEIKRCLVDIASSRLPSKMGNQYAKLVLFCLTCWDQGDDSFGEESDFVDEDGISVGVRYIEKVVALPFQAFPDGTKQCRSCYRWSRSPFETPKSKGMIKATMRFREVSRDLMQQYGVP